MADGGLPCIRDLRIPVNTVLGQLAAGRAEVEILKNLPDLEHAGIMAALVRSGCGPGARAAARRRAVRFLVFGIHRLARVGVDRVSSLLDP